MKDLEEYIRDITALDWTAFLRSAYKYVICLRRSGFLFAADHAPSVAKGFSNTEEEGEIKKKKKKKRIVQNIEMVVRNNHRHYAYLLVSFFAAKIAQ